MKDSQSCSQIHMSNLLTHFRTHFSSETHEYGRCSCSETTIEGCFPFSVKAYFWKLPSKFLFWNKFSGATALERRKSCRNVAAMVYNWISNSKHSISKLFYIQDCKCPAFAITNEFLNVPEHFECWAGKKNLWEREAGKCFWHVTFILNHKLYQS